ncbi:hypothetical protein Ancab_011008 [Ancistrocladus abbreviatus]
MDQDQNPKMDQQITSLRVNTRGKCRSTTSLMPTERENGKGQADQNLTAKKTRSLEQDGTRTRTSKRERESQRIGVMATPFAAKTRGNTHLISSDIRANPW